MLKFSAPFETTIFVCTHKRPEGHPKPCCADRGGRQLREEMREMVKARGLEETVKIFTSGCLGGCQQGPMALRYPDGTMLLGLTADDLPGLVDEATPKE